MKKLVIDCSKSAYDDDHQQVVDLPPQEISVVSPTIKQQIAALEAKQTPRRIRDAILADDNGWLVDIDKQIAALRAQL